MRTLERERSIELSPREDFLPFWTQPVGTDPGNALVRRVGLVSLP